MPTKPAKKSPAKKAPAKRPPRSVEGTDDTAEAVNEWGQPVPQASTRFDTVEPATTDQEK